MVAFELGLLFGDFKARWFVKIISRYGPLVAFVVLFAF